MNSTSSSSISDVNILFVITDLLHCILYAGNAFWPVFLLANLAALIASRTMTIAIFQCLKQSISLGCFPRLKIVHTSRKFMAKIYIPVVNWFLLASCLGFILLFRSTSDVGNAYGNSIALDMLLCLITPAYGICCNASIFCTLTLFHLEQP